MRPACSQFEGKSQSIPLTPAAPHKAKGNRGCEFAPPLSLNAHFSDSVKELRYLTFGSARGIQLDCSQSPFYFVPQEKELIWRPCWGWKNLGELNFYQEEKTRDQSVLSKMPRVQEHLTLSKPVAKTWKMSENQFRQVSLNPWYMLSSASVYFSERLVIFLV